jgi:hypothetical protein
MVPQLTYSATISSAAAKAGKEIEDMIKSSSSLFKKQKKLTSSPPED